MKIPKIEFVWSWVYQMEIHSQNVKTEEYDYESYEKYVLDFIEKMEKEWNKKGNEILRYIEEITRLKWKEERINCYVVKISAFLPCSSPLTIPIQFETQDKKIYTLGTERYIDMLIHELIHNLFVQNEKETYEYFKHIFDKYGDEYTVWIETGFAMSSLVIEICPLNERGDGADILFVSGAFSGRE